MTALHGLAIAALLLFTAACAPAHPSAEQQGAKKGGGGVFDHSPWQRVLDAYAREGGIDYAGLAEDRSELDRYLASLETAQPDEWSVAEQIAFWSNAYNAVVAEFVLERYPGVESVKDVSGFFDRQARTVAGLPMTLDEIETRGRDLGDPRVHFAVVCASTSCPDLPADAFVADRLEEQLATLTRDFLQDTDKGLRYDAETNVLWLSSIFKWYAGDFTGGSTMVAFFVRSKVAEWVAEWAPENVRQAIVERDPSIRYLDYDWSLNDR